MVEDGPGKYDDICSVAREATDAQAILLLVFAGNRGHGFSVQGYDRDLLTRRLPALLRRLADDIEREAS